VAAIQTPIRIARIVTRFGVGGVERHVSTLTANLNREKFRTWVICGRAEKDERECPEFARDAGVEPVFIESLRRNLGFWDVKASFTLHQLLKRIQTNCGNASEQGWRAGTKHGALEFRVERAAT